MVKSRQILGSKGLKKLFFAWLLLVQVNFAYADNLPLVIIGAGIAGLTAGYELKKSNLPFVLFEARDRIGGRILSARICHHITENMGGTFINLGHLGVRNLCSHMNVSLIPVYEDKINRLFFFEGKKWTSQELFTESQQTLRKILAIKNNMTPEEKVFYANLSIAECMTRLESSEVTKQWIRQTYATEHGLEPHEISCMELIEKTRINEDAWSFGDSVGDEKLTVEGGFSVLTDKLANYFSQDIHLNHQLTSIIEHGNGWELRFLTPTGEKVINAEKVILTVPLNILRHSISIQSKTLSELIDYYHFKSVGAADKVFLIFKSQFWDPKTTGWLHILTNKYELRAAPVGLAQPSIMLYRAGDLAKTAPTQEQVEECLDLLTQILGPMVRGEFVQWVQGTTWATESFSQGSYTGGVMPQNWFASQVDHLKPCLKNLCLAGEAYAPAENSGFMNGAIQTAQEAVQANVKVFDKPL